MTDTKPLLGAHESIAGGVHQALLLGREVGCDVVQIFVKTPSRWASKSLTADDIAAFQATKAEVGIWPVFGHSLYLINLASPDDELWRKSIDALADDLERCERLELPGLVIHPGSHKGAGEAVGLARICQGLESVHRRLPGYRVQVWLETTAGQGDHLGYTFGQLRAMIDGVRRQVHMRWDEETRAQESH